jgi:hypothetical protein
LEIDVNKTDYVAIDFTAKNGIMQMKDATSMQQLMARDTNGAYKPLTQLKVTDARKTLGVYQSPTGNEDAQFKYIRDIVSKWASRIKTSHISRKDTLKAIRTTIGRTLEYPLPATSLQEHQCNKIMSMFLNIALPKMGYVQTMARSIVFAPAELMGCGVRDL